MKTLEERKEKDNRLLAKYKRQRSFKPYTGYGIVVVILIIMAAMIDEMCSNIQGDLQSAIVTDFLVI